MGRARLASKAEAVARIHDALVRLGIARRERLSEEDYDVYGKALEAYPATAVVAACEELSRTPAPEYGTRFPTLGSLLEAVRGHVRREQERREMNQPRLTTGDQVSPERMQELLAQIRRACRGKAIQ